MRDVNRPSQQKGVVLHRVGQANVLSSSDGEHICTLNETAAALWELCDGDTTPDEMVDAVCQLCSVTHEVASKDVARTLEELSRAGVLRWRNDR